MDTYLPKFTHGRTEPVWFRLIRTSGHSTVSKIVTTFQESANMPPLKRWKLSSKFIQDSPDGDVTVKSPESVANIPEFDSHGYQPVLQSDNIPLEGDKTPFRYLAGELNLREGHQLRYSTITESRKLWDFKVRIAEIQRDVRMSDQPQVVDQYGSPIGGENPYQIDLRFVETGERFDWFD